jgi:heme/copper-type cytochrome/quinol oxidase subunit 3
MTNPYAPPEAPVADMNPPPAGWGKVLAMIVLGWLLANFLAWLIAPLVASAVVQPLGEEADQPVTLFLAIDLLLSIAAIFIGCRVAASGSRGRMVVAVLGVAVLSALFYLYQIGGFAGMVSAEFPLWYQFFPVNLVALLLALWSLGGSKAR